MITKARLFYRHLTLRTFKGQRICRSRMLLLLYYQPNKKWQFRFQSVLSQDIRGPENEVEKLNQHCLFLHQIINHTIHSKKLSIGKLIVERSVLIKKRKKSPPIPTSSPGLILYFIFNFIFLKVRFKSKRESKPWRRGCHYPTY